MLKLTAPAATALLAHRRQRELPEHFGVRIAGELDGEELDLKVGFVPEPAPTDAVAEQHGLKVFVADDVAPYLDDAQMDVTVAVSGDGSAPARLVVRPQDHD